MAVWPVYLRVQGSRGSLFREKIGEIADIFTKNRVIKRTQSENMILEHLSSLAREHSELERRIRLVSGIFLPPIYGFFTRTIVSPS
jgi:hypothetical protein